MKFRILFAAVVVASFASPLAAQAQGIPGGIAHGVYEGGQAAGPVGAIIGGAVGGVIGGVQGLLGIQPAYAAYPQGTPRVHRHGRALRHVHRRLHKRHKVG